MAGTICVSGASRGSRRHSRPTPQFAFGYGAPESSDGRRRALPDKSDEGRLGMRKNTAPIVRRSECRRRRRGGRGSGSRGGCQPAGRSTVRRASSPGGRSGRGRGELAANDAVRRPRGVEDEEGDGGQGERCCGGEHVRTVVGSPRLPRRGVGGTTTSAEGGHGSPDPARSARASARSPARRRSCSGCEWRYRERLRVPSTCRVSAAATSTSR